MTNNEREIKITLAEGQNKTDLFTTIALANGYTEKITEGTEKVIEIVGLEEANEEINKLRAEGHTFIKADLVGEDTHSILYSENKTVDNISAFDFGKSIVIKDIFARYEESAVVLGTLEHKKASEEAEKQIHETVKSLELPTVD